MKQIAVISFTASAFLQGLEVYKALTEDSVRLYTTKQEIAERYEEAYLVTGGLHAWCESVFAKADAILFIGAAGIAVRAIAPFVASKTSDPAVLVMDERGQHVISLLSGHLGGGNELTLQIADIIGADPVITTASDVNGKLAIDVWAQKNELAIKGLKKAKAVAAKIVEGKAVPFFCDGQIQGEIPAELNPVSAEQIKAVPGVSVAVSVYEDWPEETLTLVPKGIVLGMGCKKDKPYEEIAPFVKGQLANLKIAPESIIAIASIDLKANEQGLIRMARELKVPFVTYDAATLRGVKGTYAASAFVSQITGVDNVCERSAMATLSEEEQETASFVLRKTAGNGVTLAIIEKDWGVTF